MGPMIKNKFKESGPIVRSANVPSQTDYRKYEAQLRLDFQNRCGYCGGSHDVIRDFEIDHFIPRSKFEKLEPTLDNKYENLVYSCKKCNRAKGGKYNGRNTAPLKNEAFYDPSVTDFNNVFYRNQNGVICSDDAKGLKMIIELKLHRPVYALVWKIEQLSGALNRLGGIQTKNLEFYQIKSELDDMYRELTQLLNNWY